MSKGNVQELRVAERYGLEAKVTYESSAGMKSRGRAHDGKTVNISQGGFRIETKSPLAQSQIIRVQIPISDVDVSPPTLAEVCWVERLKKQKGYSVGLRFLL